MAIVFLLSATGVVVFQAHCLCTGNDHVSLYVSPDTCEEEFHAHHVHLQCGEEASSSETECHECSSHTNECGCNNMIISFFKLNDEVVFEKARSKTAHPVVAILPDLAVRTLSVFIDDREEKDINYIEPPAAQSSLDFLVHIHQLKIPHTA